MPNSQIRKVIADRLTFSKQSIPHYYVTVQVQVDSLMKMRAKFNKVSSVKLSVNDIVMKEGRYLDYPAFYVNPNSGNLEWYLDKDATNWL